MTRSDLSTMQQQQKIDSFTPNLKGVVMRQIVRFLLVAVVVATVFTTTASADEVTDWNRNLFEAARVNLPPTSPLAITRSAALVQAAVFDAVNGIDRRFTPVHVDPAAPDGASKRAAAVQAAYAMLIRLYPTQSAALSAKRADSLALIGDSQLSINLGIAWGQTVADAIWNWRLTDGITPAPPPFLGGLNVGQWRPTPPGNLPGAGVQFSYMTPWVIASPSQFRPAGPPALTSARYTADFNETKTMGSLNSLSRTDDQTLFSRFWAVSTASLLLEPDRALSRRQGALLIFEASPPAGLAQPRHCGRSDWLLGGEIHLRLLAARHGHSIGQH